MILTIRSDNPEAEVGLFDGQNQCAYRTWQAHRELSATILKVIRELLDETGQDWTDISGIIFYEGPGSFTGLRIGAAVANGIAGIYGVKVINRSGDNWVQAGIKALEAGEGALALPEYGADPHITAQKK